jgi:hypothetical protein
MSLTEKLPEPVPLVPQKPLLITILKKRRTIILPNIFRPVLLVTLEEFATKFRRPEMVAEILTYAVTRVTTPMIREYLLERVKGRRPLFERFSSILESAKR